MKMTGKLLGLCRRLTRGRALWGLTLGFVLAAFVILASWGFADNAVKLVKMEPSGEVGTKTNFLFTFSGDVIPKSMVGKSMTSDQIKFKPAVPGKICWLDTKRLRYYPEVILRPSTAYYVEFSADLPGQLQKKLVGDRRWEFTTERFRVTDFKFSFVYNAERRSGLRFEARVSFNCQVSAEAIQRGLSLSFADNHQKIKFTVQIGNEGRLANITSELLQRGREARRIELSLPDGFLCIGGQIGLKGRYEETIDFRERQDLTVNGVSARIDGGLYAITISCSEPVDPETASGFITVKPAVKFRVGVNGSEISLTGEGFKPGRTYEVKLDKDLPSLNGNPLKHDYVDQLTFPDLDPSIAFNSPGRYLSSKGRLNLGLETVNIGQAEVEITRIFANNLVAFLGCLDEDGGCYSENLEKYGQTLETRTYRLANQENEAVTTPINLGQYLSGKPGIFQVSARDPENRWREAAKMAIVTDLGILAKAGPDEMMVWVNSLDNLTPKQGVKVTLLSYNNQEITSGVTDADGVVRFTGLRRMLKEFRSYLILAEQGSDVSFVRLADALIDQTDFPIEGKPQLTEGYEAFLYTDRGVFRPGDTVNLSSIVRGPRASIPEEFPVSLRIVGPDGMVFREYADSTKKAGLSQFKVEIPDYARTGKYTALLYVAKQNIGSAEFSVEEFMPDRIKVEAVTDKPSYNPGDKASIKVSGVNLFGPPAAGRRADLTVRLEPAPFSPPAYRSYVFGDPNREARVVEETVGRGELDENGEAVFKYDFPDNLNPQGYIRAVFQATVTEEGGRAVSAYKTADYFPHKAFIGVKAAGDYYAKVGEAYQIRLAELDSSGRPTGAASLAVEIYAVTWNSIYRRDDNGHYTYHSERQQDLAGRDTVKLTGGEGTYTYKPKIEGCYLLVFSDQAAGASSSFEFYATGWGYAPWAMDHPDRIQLDLDKQSYKAGEKATVNIKAPFSGRALVTVEREKIFDTYVVELKENTGVLAIPVKEEYKPNVYVSVHLIRAIKNLDKRAPSRAFGTVPLTVDCSVNRLDIKIEAAGEYRPNKEIEVQVAAGGGKTETYLTLAAVDEGICQLTDFTTPDPMDFFYGKRALGLTAYDLYGMLLPEVESVKASDSPAGDAEEVTRRRNLNPVAVRRVKPVSLWSGLVKLNGDGKARIKLNLPQFNGTLRLMAVAVSGSDFGSATKKVLVRDPIVLTSTFPRFLAPGDRVVIPVSVANGTGADGTFQIKLTMSGPVEIDGYDEKTLELADAEKTVRFAVVAKQQAGACRFRLEASGNGNTVTELTDLAVRPPQPLIRQSASGSVTAKKPEELDLTAAWLPGTASTSLLLTPMPGVKFAAGLRYLLGYPYGCIEQTTSKLFPMLYFADLARLIEPESFKGNAANHYIEEGIDKLTSMQVREGGFSYWPGMDWVSEWGSVYASHFFVEARKAGYTVPDRVYDRMLLHLDQLAAKRSDNPWSLELRVYALYVLSSAGEPQLGSMSYIRSQRLGDLWNDSRAMLAAAYYYANDKKTARELLPNTFAPSTVPREKGGNFNSPVRTDAVILGVLAELDPGNAAVPKLIQRLSGAVQACRWGTTQEDALAFMAMGKILKQKGESNYTGEVQVNGKKIASFSSKEPLRLNDPVLSKGKVTLKITGTGDCYYYAETSGVPMTAQAEKDNGLQVRRVLLDRAGRNVDLNHIKQGDLLVAQITVTTMEDSVDNVAIVDLLPAGLEIENPRLATSAKVDWLSRDLFTPDYMDIRDDRLMLFASFDSSGTRSFYYAVRAVGCGSFTLPPIKAECMYEPDVWSLSSGGSCTVEK